MTKMTTDALQPRNRGYYRNSLKAWRARLLKERRLSAARHERMKAMMHPDADDQGLCVRHLEQILEVIDNAERVADALERAPRRQCVDCDDGPCYMNCGPAIRSTP